LYCAMKPLDKTLVTKLAVVLLIKLAILVGLWWGFVRDQRVAVDGGRVADRFLLSRPDPALGESP